MPSLILLGLLAKSLRLVRPCCIVYCIL